jgi:hypothetical protein
MFAIAQVPRVSASSTGCTSKLGARIFHARPKTFHVSHPYAPNHHAYMRATTARVSMAAVGIGISALSLSFAPSKIYCDGKKSSVCQFLNRIYRNLQLNGMPRTRRKHATRFLRPLNRLCRCMSSRSGLFVECAQGSSSKRAQRLSPFSSEESSSYCRYLANTLIDGV